jgi:succinyl-CoA synthetase beta subunit
MLNSQCSEIVAASRKQGWLTEPRAKRLLDHYGVPVPDFRVAANSAEALAAAHAVGFPVAAKVVSAEIVHKTEVDGVALGLTDADDVRAVFERFAALPGFEGMLVEPMVSGVELIIGAKNDEQFGPVILLGIGGTGVELCGDTAIRMAPLTDTDIPVMVKRLKGRQVIEGFRGRPGVDMTSLTKIMRAFSRLTMDMAEEFESIDLNPVMCNSEGCIVADARVMLSGSSPI